MKILNLILLMLLMTSLVSCGENKVSTNGQKEKSALENKSSVPTDSLFAMATNITEYFDSDNYFEFGIRDQVFSPDGQKLITIAQVRAIEAEASKWVVYLSTKDDEFSSMTVLDEVVGGNPNLGESSAPLSIIFKEDGTEFYVFGYDAMIPDKILKRYQGAGFSTIDEVYRFGEGTTDYMHHGKMRMVNNHLYLFSPFADGITNGKVAILDPSRLAVDGVSFLEIGIHTAHRAFDWLVDFEVDPEGEWIFYAGTRSAGTNQWFLVWKENIANPTLLVDLDENFANVAHTKIRKLYMSPLGHLIAHGHTSITGKDLASALKMYHAPDYANKTYIEGFSTGGESMEGVYGNPYFVPNENPFLNIDQWSYKGYGIRKITFNEDGSQMYAIGDYTIGQSSTIVSTIYYGENYSKSKGIEIYNGIYAGGNAIAYNTAENYVRLSGSTVEYQSQWDAVLGTYYTQMSYGISSNLILEEPIVKK